MIVDKLKAYGWQALALVLAALLSWQAVARLGAERDAAQARVELAGERDASATARTELVSMQQQRDGALKGAQACSDATEALGTMAAQRAADAAPARAAAAGQAQALNARADYTLSRQPSAGDSCAALQVLGADWLKGRAKP